RPRLPRALAEPQALPQRPDRPEPIRPRRPLMTGKPSVLFVCVKNGGKSQMAAALLRHRAGGAVEVHSAGTHPGDSLNQQSVQVLAESGAEVAGERPKPIDPELLRRANRVIVLGQEPHVEAVEGMTATIETWATDEPS